MKGSKSRNRGRNTRFLAGACLVGGFAIAFPQLSHADVVIDVGMSDGEMPTNNTGSPSNGDVVPLNYVPVQVTVADAPGQTYCDADTSDTGQIFNSLQTSSGNSGASVPSILFEQNLPLVSSTGAALSAELNVSVLEGSSSKFDFPHVTHNSNLGTSTTGTGTDGFNANPASSTYSGGSLVGDGYNNSASDQLSMGTEWVTNSTSDGFQFEVTGLTAYIGDTFKLYVYGAGSADGSGGVFTLAASNGGLSASTNSNTSAKYLSVFDSTGINPLPEKGLSWNVISGTVDTNGDVTFTESNNPSDGAKASINSFQLDLANVPEPTTLGLLGLGGMGLLARRRPKANA